MANNVVEPEQIQSPEEFKLPEGGSRYEDYKNDGVYEYALKPNGKKDKSKVKIAYNNGDVFDGKLKRGKYEGNGSYYWKNGGTYEGAFEKGTLSGTGKYTAANGDVYEGSFKNNKYEGKGTYTWKDGSTFEGTFKDGQLVGGQYTDVNGNVYKCSYNYNRSGERKNGTIRLIQAAKPKQEHKEETKPTPRKKSEKKDGLENKDRTLITSIRRSKCGDEFKKLHNGAAGNGPEEEKKYMAILNFFSDGNREQMERIYHASKLYDQTKSSDHVNGLIAGAIQGSQKFAADIKARARNNQNANTNNAAAGAAR